jgi:hypothetical protein
MSIPTPLEFHRARKRPDYQPVIAMHGFGEGDMTLWLPPCEADTYTEKLGRTPRSWMDADLRAGREKLVNILAKGNALELLTVMDLFYAYAAALVNASYQAPGSGGDRLSDADLTYILCRSEKWYGGMVRHIIGFDASLKVLTSAGSLLPGVDVLKHVPQTPAIP